MALGVLIGHFGDLVRLRNAAIESGEAPPPVEDFTPELAALRERLGHHLIPLALMARSDGDFADAERDIIVAHCRAIAALDDAQSKLLEGYLSEQRPSLIQLDPALHRLQREEAHHLEALVAAVEQLIGADGRIDPAEIALLDHMRTELRAMQD